MKKNKKIIYIKMSIKQIYRLAILCSVFFVICSFNISCVNNISNNKVDSKLSKFGIELMRCYHKIDTNGYLSLVYPKYFEQDKHRNLQLMLSAFLIDAKDIQNILSNFSSDKVKVTLESFDKKYQKELCSYLNAKFKILRIRTAYTSPIQGSGYAFHDFIIKEKGKYYLVFRDYLDPIIACSPPLGMEDFYTCKNYYTNTEKSMSVAPIIERAEVFIKQEDIENALILLKIAQRYNPQNPKVQKLITEINDGRISNLIKEILENEKEQ